jgi:2-aminoadipate transaminase
MLDWHKAYADRMELLMPSVAGAEILKLAERPDVISFAGGLPDPRSFPVESIREAMERVLSEEGPAALNYGPNAGYSKLRDWIAERLDHLENIRASRENILVTSGGVEALNLVSMALLNPGDTVLVGAPTYLVALHVLRAYQARLASVSLDENGMDTEELDERLSELASKGTQPKFLYVIPSFQNPSGLTLSEERRHRLLEICSRFDVPVVEDHAYADLWFEGRALPTLKSLAPDKVILIHTFSKVFAPGVRLGWAAADPDLILRLGLCKIGTDSCANTLAQRLVYAYGSQGGIDEQIAASIDLYRRKRDMLLKALERELSGVVTWTTPRGGFYVWAELPEGADSELLLRHAIEKEKTAFVAGPPFFADGSGSRFVRLAYSFVPDEQIDEGIRRLARSLDSVIG